MNIGGKSTDVVARIQYQLNKFRLLSSFFNSHGSPSD